MFRHIFIACLVFFLSACGTSPKTHFYLLSQDHPADKNAVHNADGLRIGVWKARLPEFLDRSEIVTRNGQHNIELSDFHKWAGRLDNNLSRLVADELGERLHTGRVAVSPWPAYIKNNYQVKLYIERFDGQLGGEIVLSGAWSLLNGGGNKELAWEPFTFKTTAASATYSDMIAALSTLTVQLADRIATTIDAR